MCQWLIVICNRKTVAHNLPAEATYTELGVGWHLEMIAVNVWCAGGMGGGLGKWGSVNGGDGGRLLSNLSPIFSWKYWQTQSLWRKPGAHSSISQPSPKRPTLQDLVGVLSKTASSGREKKTISDPFVEYRLLIQMSVCLAATVTTFTEGGLNATAYVYRLLLIAPTLPCMSVTFSRRFLLHSCKSHYPA